MLNLTIACLLALPLLAVSNPARTLDDEPFVPESCPGCTPDAAQPSVVAAHGLGYVKLSWYGVAGACEKWNTVGVDVNGDPVENEVCLEGDPDFCDVTVVRETGNVDAGSAVYAQKSDGTGDRWDRQQNFPVNGTLGAPVPRKYEISCGDEFDFKLFATVNGSPVSVELTVQCTNCAL